MNDHGEGTLTLARFVSATVGRRGHCLQIHGGHAMACTYDIQNAYFTTAIRTDPTSDPGQFIGEAQEFFAEINRSFKVWVPTDDHQLRAELRRVGGVADSDQPPAMSIDHPIQSDTKRFTIRVAETPSDYQLAGDTIEAGYESPGLAWLLGDQEFYETQGSTWVTAFDGDAPVGGACGYLSESIGGIYFVGTPPAHRGRGVGAEITSWLVNHLCDQGAKRVTLQASQMGLGVYERIGFTPCGQYERFVVHP